MSTPTKVLSLFGKNVKVVIEDMPQHLGAYSRDRLEILVRGDLHPATLESTLLHEVLEAIISELEIKISHADICRLEVGLYQTLTQNGVSLKPLAKGVGK